MPKAVSTLGIIVAAILWGSVGPFVILAEAIAPTAAFLRCSIAVVVLAPRDPQTRGDPAESDSAEGGAGRGGRCWSRRCSVPGWES